jgi:hypothetical protein
MHQSLFISHEPIVHAERLAALAKIGFDTIILHNVGRNQGEFIDTFAERVLPRLR